MNECLLNAKCFFPPKSYIQLVHVGTKMFDKSSRERSACDYRIAQDGLPYLLPHITKRVIQVDRGTFVSMLANNYLDLLSLSEKLKGEVEELEPGSFVCVLDPLCLSDVSGKKTGVCGCLDSIGSLNPLYNLSPRVIYL